MDLLTYLLTCVVNVFQVNNGNFSRIFRATVQQNSMTLALSAENQLSTMLWTELAFSK